MAATVNAPPRMTARDIETFLESEFPQMNHGGKIHFVESVRPLGAVVRMAFHERNVRPGGTLSGPSMMGLSDYTMYVALLAQLGPVPLAVTTNLTINFLRKPEQRDLLADCTLIKLGRRLAVGEVALRCDGQAAMIAHAVLTYSIPPDAVL